ncbi:hypothetical protein [Candidatus Contubernalis alkaliaceticus]|nr:hypothetical protein [Candidatus Contubernalis alkalaceticus]UNC91269.1 hypothetical protein HUE98_03700 [Candidatus Contubernalis alkalaceticus]
MEKNYHRPKEINTKEFQGKEVNLFVYGTLMKKKNEKDRRMWMMQNI